MHHTPFITEINGVEQPVTIGIYLCDELGDDAFAELIQKLRLRSKPRHELESEVELGCSIFKSIRERS